jgi:hypothetical protein
MRVKMRDKVQVPALGLIWRLLEATGCRGADDSVMASVDSKDQTSLRRQVNLSLHLFILSKSPMT